MIGSLAFIDGIKWRAAGCSSIETPVRVLTVGLGGGALQMYMDTCLSNQVLQLTKRYDLLIIIIILLCVHLWLIRTDA